MCVCVCVLCTVVHCELINVIDRIERTRVTVGVERDVVTLERFVCRERVCKGE